MFFNTAWRLIIVLVSQVLQLAPNSASVRSLLLLLGLFTAALSQAQSITGRVLDPTSTPIPLANVLLTDTGNVLLKAAVTDMDGKFHLSSPRSGTFGLVLSAVGFSEDTLSITVGEVDLALGAITMQQNAEVLAGAEITATKPLVTVDPDKMVLNVAEHLSASGANGLELLRKAPGVMIDNNDNIIVEGKSGVQVFIDGRPSPLRGEDLANYLKGLQSTDVESIEIITQPSSKYDASGNAGIINIILKREKGLGTNGTVTAGFVRGKRSRYNGSLNLNHRNQVLNAFANYSTNVGESYNFMNFYRSQNGYEFISRRDLIRGFENHNLQVGADVYAGKRSTIGVQLNASPSETNINGASYSSIFTEGNTQADSVLFAPTESIGSNFSGSANLNYRFKDTTGVALSMDLDMARFERTLLDKLPNYYLSPNGETIYTAKIAEQQTPIEIQLYSAKFDYERPFLGGKFSGGGKWAKVETNNTLDYYKETDGVLGLDSSRSNTFNYDEQVYAAYINQSFKLGKWGVQTGVRMEHTESLGDLQSFVETDNETVPRSYTDWFPSGGLTFAQNQINTWALTYSRRIQRPNYTELNPFVYQLDELSSRRGNPFLQPQYTNNYKLTHTYKYTLNTSFSYSHISDFTAQVTQSEDEIRSVMSSLNVADQHIYNLSISYPFKINNWWSMFANVYGYYANYVANDPAFFAVDRTTYGGYAQSTFTLHPKFSLELSGWYNSPSIWGGTYLTESLGALNLGAKYDFSPSGSIRVALNDMLYTQPWDGHTEFAGVVMDGTGGSDSRQVRINLSWRFGDSEVKSAKKRKTGLEDETGRIGG